LEPRLPLHGVASAIPFNGQANVTSGVNVMAVFDFDADPATVNSGTFQLRDPQGALVSATISYNATTRTATLDPVAALPNVADYYRATVKGGTDGVRELGTDAPIEADFNWYFIRQSPGYSDTVIFSGLTEPTAVEFSSDGRVFVAE
jgi:hypothetical protein